MFVGRFLERGFTGFSEHGFEVGEWAGGTWLVQAYVGLCASFCAPILTRLQ